MEAQEPPLKLSFVLFASSETEIRDGNRGTLFFFIRNIMLRIVTGSSS